MTGGSEPQGDALQGDAPQGDALRLAELRAALVAELTADGDLRSPAWIEAFTTVPRDAFVPSFFCERADAPGFERVGRDQPGTYGDWLRSVYNNDVLYTQLNDDGAPTSSSTSPGLMALMLEALEIESGMNILEIGTGTGYNAALLCRRLGSGRVTSVDIDRELIGAARERLGSLGYVPHLAVGDAMGGYPGNAPYDRIISTVGVPRIPPAWIAQVSEGGCILANLYRELGGGALARLTVHGDYAEGRFLPQFGGFMPVREIRRPAPVSLLRAAGKDTRGERETQIDGKVLDDASFAFFAALLVPAQRLGYVPHGGAGQFWLLGADGSWARQTTGENGHLAVCQHGPRMLWDALEQAHRDWASLGSPSREEFGLRVIADGTHTLRYEKEPSRTWALALP